MAVTQEQMQENIDKLKALKGHISSMTRLCRQHHRPLFTKGDGTRVRPTAATRTKLVEEYQTRKAALADLIDDLL